MNYLQHTYLCVFVILNNKICLPTEENATLIISRVHYFYGGSEAYPRQTGPTREKQAYPAIFRPIKERPRVQTIW